MINIQDKGGLYAITDYRVDIGDEDALLGVVMLTPDEDDGKHYFFYPNSSVIPLTRRQMSEISEFLHKLNVGESLEGDSFTKYELDRLDGIFAFDGGCASSGIKDNAFKESLALNPEKLDAMLTALIKRYMSDDAYKFEDAASLVKWAENEMGYHP